MDLRPLVDGYTVAPQLEPGDMAALAEQGITTVICNRPDAEVPPPLQAAAIQAAAEAAGLTFVYNPIVGGAMTEDNVEEQAEAIAASEGPVVAYCASGNRSSQAWAFGVAGEIDIDTIVAAGDRYGYPLAALRPHLEAMAARKG